MRPTSLRQFAGSLYVSQWGSSDAGRLVGVVSRIGEGEGEVRSRGEGEELSAETFSSLSGADEEGAGTPSWSISSTRGEHGKGAEKRQKSIHQSAIQISSCPVHNQGIYIQQI